MSTDLDAADLDAAITEISTLVRLGTAIFGHCNQRNCNTGRRT